MADAAYGIGLLDHLNAHGFKNIPIVVVGGEVQGRENLTAEQNAALDAALSSYDPLGAVKTVRIVAATAASDAILAPYGVEYGPYEMATWDQQYAEAVALMADPNAAVPLLDALATARGMAVAALAQRIIRNREVWSALTGSVVGQRLAIVDRINAATSVEEVAAVDVTIKLPG